ncbi:hypothetical protein IWW43_004411, partial [Coemansia sp. RSA 1935]
MQTQAPRDCHNRRCPRVHWNGLESAPFCSHQCAYSHALESYRRSTPSYAPPTAVPATQLDQSGWPIRLGKCHTFTLIRCGIDPWASPAEIQMRLQSCHVLIAVLGRYSSNSNIGDYAWPLENISYCISYLPEFEINWSAHPDVTQSSCLKRYQLLCALLLRQIERDVPFVCALLGG